MKKQVKINFSNIFMIDFEKIFHLLIYDSLSS